MTTTTTATATTTPAADSQDAQLRQAEASHGLADLADTEPAEPGDPSSGEAGSAVSPPNGSSGSDAAHDQARDTDAKDRDAQRLVTPDPELSHSCSWCGRGFKSGPALGGHKKNCPKRPEGGAAAEKKAKKQAKKQRPAGDPVDPARAWRPPPRRAGAAPAAAAPTPGAAAAAAAAAARESLEDGAQHVAAAGGGIPGMARLVGRLQEGKVGVPELSALACESNLPPPLKPAEYAALVGVWASQIRSEAIGNRSDSFRYRIRFVIEALSNSNPRRFEKRSASKQSDSKSKQFVSLSKSHSK